MRINDADIRKIIDGFIIYLCLECGWESILQFNADFSRRYGKYHVKKNKLKRMNFSRFCRLVLKLPPMALQLIRVTMGISLNFHNYFGRKIRDLFEHNKYDSDIGRIISNRLEIDILIFYSCFNWR